MAISISGILFIAAGICATVALIVYHIKRLQMYRNAAKFPGPPVLPIIGNVHYFLGCNNEDFFKQVLKLTDSYASPFTVWMATELYFVFYDPESIKAILLSQNAIEKGSLYDLARVWIGTGLITAPAAKWRVHRKLIQPTFNQRILESFLDIFGKQSEILKNSMSKEVNRGEFDISDYIARCTLDIICETTMGVDLKTQVGNDSRYFDASKSQTEITFSRMYKLWLRPDIIFNLTEYGRKQRENVEYLHSVADDLIKKKMSVYEKATRVTTEKAAPEKSTKRKVFLDLLMELSNDGAKLTSKELREEVDTMMIAGSETNATTDCFALVMLANYPEIQEKVYQELCDIYGDKVSSVTPVTKEDLNRMEYLERVIKETLRLFPPGGLLARAISDDIKIGDRTVPKGSGAILAAIKLHRWEKYWPDPLKFDPDRFLPEEVAKRDPYCYIPFSGGARGCIGPVFAMWSMKAVLSTLLRRYVFRKDEFFNVEDIKLKTDFVLKPAKPLTVKIVDRNVVHNSDTSTANKKWFSF